MGVVKEAMYGGIYSSFFLDRETAVQVAPFGRKGSALNLQRLCSMSLCSSSPWSGPDVCKPDMSGGPTAKSSPCCVEVPPTLQQEGKCRVK